MLHKMLEVPAGKCLADVVPAFAGVAHSVHVGEPNKSCPSCRKTFTAARKPRRSILIAWPAMNLPVALSLAICGGCFFRYRKGGVHRDAMLAAIEAYVDGAEASQ